MNQKEISVQSSEGDFTPDKAWLLGLMAGDGHLSDRPAYRTYEIVLAPGPEEALARESARTVSAVYGDDIKVRLDTPEHPTDTWLVAFHSIAVVEDLKSIAPFGRHRWRVPERILKGSKEIQAHWIAGFCDADGCAQHKIMRSSRSVCMDSVNDVGLRQVAKMVSGLGIDNSLFPNRRKKTEQNKNHSVGWKLLVSHRPSLERFVEKIPLRCQAKRETLQAALLSYKKQTLLRNKDGQKLVPEIEKRLADGKCYAQIAAEIGLRDKDQVRQTLRYAESDARPGRGHGERHQQITKMWPEMRAHFDVGKTIAQVAEFFGLTAEQVKGIMRARDYKYGRGRGRESERGDVLRAAAPMLTGLADAGFTNKEICARPEVIALDLIPTRLGNFFTTIGYRRPPDIAERNRRRKQIEGELARDKERTARKVAEWEALNAAEAAKRQENKPEASDGPSENVSVSESNKENQ